MDRVSQLEAYASELIRSVQSLASYCRNTKSHPLSSTPRSLVPPEAPQNVHRTRRTVLASITNIQIILADPVDFLQHLASQNQLVACLQWLGDFQVLACIPLSGSVPIKDVAKVVAVPETQLCRIVRMTATSGFLHEAQHGQVAHTALSALFLSKQSLRDAATFLAETAAPAAMQMMSVTHRYGGSDQTSESAYNIAFDTFQTFESACEQQPKVRRQWLAYLQHIGDADDSITSVLTRLDWINLGNSVVVEVGAQSSEMAEVLAELHPALQFIVQTHKTGSSKLPRRKSSSNSGILSSTDSSTSVLTPTLTNGTGRQQSDLISRITAYDREPGTPQTISNAAVYILHVPPLSSNIPSSSMPAQIIGELRAHLHVLSANSSATLFLAARLLPELGNVDPNVEAPARVRDLSLFQLANEREMEVSELVEIVNSVNDSGGRLIVASKLRSRNNVTVALSVKYQAYGSQPCDVLTALTTI